MDVQDHGPIWWGIVRVILYRIFALCKSRNTLCLRRGTVSWEWTASIAWSQRDHEHAKAFKDSGPKGMAKKIALK